VSLHDLAVDGQAQPGARCATELGRLAPLEALENPRLFRDRDARPRIGHAQSW
jgi:hypothetical protein